MSAPCCICGRTTCLHLYPLPDYSRPRLPFGGLPPAHPGHEPPPLWLLVAVLSPRPASLIYVKPFFHEPPQFVPSVPYLPVPPMLIGDPHGEPLYTLRPDGSIWHDGDEYASGDDWSPP